jgi:simple sugar transport system substrate-binding protein
MYTIKRYSSIASIAVVTVILTGCVGSPSTDTAASKQTGETASDLTITFAGFAGPDAPFWKIMNAGAEQAAKDLDVTLDWVYPDSFTVNTYNQTLQQVVASKPDGLVVMDIEGGQEEIAKQAKQAGIAIVANPAPPTGQLDIRPSDDTYVNRIGADEFSAGQAVAQKMIDEGLNSNALCVVMESGNDSLMQRCAGVEDILKQNGLALDVQFTPNNDTSAAASKTLVSSYLRANPDVGGIVGLSSGPNIGAVQAVAELGLEDSIIAVGFDLDPDTLAAVKDGKLLAVADQQPWWRGYMSVLTLVHNIRYGLVQANYFLTGPSLVTAENVDQVMELAEKNIR